MYDASRRRKTRFIRFHYSKNSRFEKLRPLMDVIRKPIKRNIYTNSRRCEYSFLMRIESRREHSAQNRMTISKRNGKFSISPLEIDFEF